MTYTAAPRTKYNDPLAPARVDDGGCIGCPTPLTADNQGPDRGECRACYNARMIFCAEYAARKAARKAAR